MFMSHAQTRKIKNYYFVWLARVIFLSEQKQLICYRNSHDTSDIIYLIQ